MSSFVNENMEGSCAPLLNVKISLQEQVLPLTGFISVKTLFFLPYLLSLKFYKKINAFDFTNLGA